MTFEERRQPPFDARLSGIVLQAWAVVSVLVLVLSLKAIWLYQLPDPDDQLRLIQVRDLLAGQSWFDVHQHRADPQDGGVPMHWSRLVDLPLAAVILLFRPLFGQPAAETIALIGVPLLTFGCVMLLAARIAYRLLGPDAAKFTCYTLAFCVPALEQLRPLRIDHHGWQLVLLLAAVNGLLARSPRIGGRIAGIALAALTSISIEGLPLALAVLGIGAWRWLRRPSAGAFLVEGLGWFAVGSGAIFLATRGVTDLARHCDAIGPHHIAVFLWVAGVIGALALLRPRQPIVLFAGFTVAAAGGLAIMLSAAPQCAGGAFAAVDPVVRALWLDRINEGLPIWHQEPSYAAQVLVLPILGLFAALNLASRSGNWLRWWWLEYAVLLFAALAVTLFVVRAAAAAGVLAAVPLGWQLRQWLEASRRIRNPLRLTLVYAAVVAALVPAGPAMLLVWAVPGIAGPKSSASTDNSATLTDAQMQVCRNTAAPAQLRGIPATTILAPIDLAPKLLLETDHAVIATGHHRGSSAMREVIDSFVGPEARAHQVVARHHVGIVLTCAGQPEFEMYRRYAPNGLAAALAAKRPPPWLVPMPIDQDSPYRLWRVIG